MCDITDLTKEGTKIVVAIFYSLNCQKKIVPTTDIHVALIEIHCVNERANGELKWKICKKVIFCVPRYITRHSLSWAKL